MSIIGDSIDNKNSSEQISLLQQEIDSQVRQCLTEATSEGHLYPVSLVDGWTKELKSYNTVLEKYIEQFNEINLDNVDRTWLRKQVEKFVTWLKDKLNKLRQKIIDGLKGMIQPIKEFLTLIEPIVNISISLDTVVSWAMSVISFFMKPYMTVVQFMSDFASYTPPLISEAGSLAGNVATVPGAINAKVNELQGEGSDIIKEEIANAVAGVAFEPPSMGDVM